jgi:hypothetical protein
MSDKKQTAVEWLLKELEEQKLIKLDKLSTILFNKNFATRYELIVHQALEMEKEQIKDAWMDGMEGILHEIAAEKYYNETYGK